MENGEHGEIPGAESVFAGKSDACAGSPNRNNQVISMKEDFRKETRFLAEDILFKIFLLLPARVLHDVMRLVCKAWQKVIRDPIFTKTHLLQSSYNSPIRVRCSTHTIRLFYLNKDDTTTKLKKRIQKYYIAHGVGLILTADYNNHSNVYLLNPITNQTVPLPHLPVKCTGYFDWAVGFSRSTSKYKVVYIKNYKRSVYICTVDGVDKEWREILMESDIMKAVVDLEFDDECYTPQPLCNSPQGIFGLVYWYHCSKGFLIVLDLEEEIFYKVDPPKEFEGMDGYCQLVKSDTILSIAANQDYWRFWELVDYKNGGEWRMLGILDFECKTSVINEVKGVPRDNSECFVDPVFMSGDEVTFWCRDSSPLLSYNFKSRMVSRSIKNPYRTTLIFTNSLIVL